MAKLVIDTDNELLLRKIVLLLEKNNDISYMAHIVNADNENKDEKLFLGKAIDREDYSGDIIETTVYYSIVAHSLEEAQEIDKNNVGWSHTAIEFTHQLSEGKAEEIPLKNI